MTHDEFATYMIFREALIEHPDVRIRLEEFKFPEDGFTYVHVYMQNENTGRLRTVLMDASYRGWTMEHVANAQAAEFDHDA
jgi:hypothetical protein